MNGYITGVDSTREPVHGQNVSRSERSESAASGSRTAFAAGYRPPRDFARALSRAVTDYGIACMRVGRATEGDYLAASEAKAEAFEAVLDMLYGPRAGITDDSEREGGETDE